MGILLRWIQYAAFSALLVLSAGFLYLAYVSTGAATPTFASAVATFSLVVITAWYAASTRALLAATQEQAKATRGAYAPRVEVSGWQFGKREAVSTNGLNLSIANTGEGVCGDINVRVDLSVDGRTFQYVGQARRSIGSGHYAELSIEPHYFLSARLVEQLGEDPQTYIMVTEGGTDYCGVPIIDLLDLFYREDPEQVVRLSAVVEYSDVQGRVEAVSVISNEPLDTSSNDLDKAIGTYPSGRSRGARRFQPLKRVGDRLRGLVHQAPPYEEMLDVSIEPIP